MSIEVVQDAYSVNDQIVANYLRLAGLVILVWDHLLTFSMEVEYCWKDMSKFIKNLFLFNRYFSLLGTVVVTIPLFPSSLPASTTKLMQVLSCGPFHIFREIVLMITEVVVSILLTDLVLYGFIRYNSGWARFDLLLISHAAQEAAAWEALLVYDMLLFVMVLLKGYKMKRSSERVPILEIVLRHGAIYFVPVVKSVMALANLANILTFYVRLSVSINVHKQTDLISARSVSVRWAFHKRWSIHIFQRCICNDDLSSHVQPPRKYQNRSTLEHGPVEHGVDGPSRIVSVKSNSE
ncbi:hypothetical protein K435DRAFT_836765 [Dendrothele bispora CBS 962.96]|uniref:DUF6533 domain-containing protein n=1 Tax=Dendrothele bispora (strain CBS 962.96) TaxID=1314807 RepID=A0A4S8MGC2_DENBC|nr:hypothetical protein K435DRAFT_836765 [Dendrothele bispora CBS 962.96]